MVGAATRLVDERTAVFIAIADERHRPIPQRRHQQRPRGGRTIHPVFFHDDEVRVDVHAASRTLGGDVLDFTRPIAIEDVTAEHALDDLALGRVEFFRRREYTLHRRNAVPGAFHEGGEAGDG